MYPQLGPALGFLLSSATCLITSLTMSDAAFVAWGWRIPFLGSAVLIVVGFFARMALEEPAAFQQAIKEKNYVYAMTLADKAATLAEELAGR